MARRWSSRMIRRQTSGCVANTGKAGLCDSWIMSDEHGKSPLVFTQLHSYAQTMDSVAERGTRGGRAACTMSGISSHRDTLKQSDTTVDQEPTIPSALQLSRASSAPIYLTREGRV